MPETFTGLGNGVWGHGSPMLIDGLLERLHVGVGSFVSKPFQVAPDKKVQDVRVW